MLQATLVALGKQPLQAGDCLATLRFGERGVAGAQAVVPTPSLDDLEHAERWPATGPVTRRQHGAVHVATDGRWLFATVCAAGAGGDGLEAVAHESYRQLLQVTELEGYPFLQRVWNFVPRINDLSLGSERYKLFCKARAEACEAHYGPAFRARLPAASAVGCRGDQFVLHAVAARHAGVNLENPRQISACNYPERYGTFSPSFARATLSPASLGGGLWISGTASIVGHDSVHPGDPEAQTEETMRNIEVLLDTAGLSAAGTPLGSRLRLLRVYVRDPAHTHRIRAALQRVLAHPVQTHFVQADVCRAELLVEIEALADAPSATQTR